jgi:hypothetical protein
VVTGGREVTSLVVTDMTAAAPVLELFGPARVGRTQLAAPNRHASDDAPGTREVTSYWRHGFGGPRDLTPESGAQQTLVIDWAAHAVDSRRSAMWNRDVIAAGMPKFAMEDAETAVSPPRTFAIDWTARAADSKRSAMWNRDVIAAGVPEFAMEDIEAAAMVPAGT